MGQKTLSSDAKFDTDTAPCYACHMSQPERPADLARTSGLIPADDPPVRTLSPWGFLHYGQTYKRAPYVSTNIVLGARYSSVVLEAMCAGNAEGWVDSPDARMVQKLMQEKTPLHRRMNYRWLLEQELGLAPPNSAREHWLQNERRLWLIFDLAEMEDKLDRLECSVEQALRSPNEHWIWVRNLVPGHATPTTSSWRGMKHVPVHRLLWPMVYPGRPYWSSPQREHFCVEKRCVNPNHFYDPSTRPSLSIAGPGRGREGQVVTGTRVKWTIDDVFVLPDGTRSIKCPNCSERIRDRTALAIVNDPAGIPPKGGQMYCWSCYQIWKRRVFGAAPRELRVPDKLRLETKNERAQREFEEAQRRQERQARGLRFDWDSDIDPA